MAEGVTITWEWEGEERDRGTAVAISPLVNRAILERCSRQRHDTSPCRKVERSHLLPVSKPYLPTMLQSSHQVQNAKSQNKLAN